MKLTFPSREFDEAVAAACHGSVSDEQARALNELLRSNASARDDYILRLELHSRLASEPDLFAETNERKIGAAENILPLQSLQHTRTRKTNWVLSLAACVPATDWKTRSTGMPHSIARIWFVTCVSTQDWVGMS